MIVSSYGVFSGTRGMGRFGAVSPLTKAQCPAGSSADVWCNCMWPVAQDPGMNAKCKATPWGPLTAAPWTAVGAGQRGIPFTGDLSGPAAQPVDQGAATYTVGSDDSFFGIPKTVLYVGGGLLGVGVLAMALSGKKKKSAAVAGYRRSRKARR